jgi:dTDP-4-dehydrorhamnose reductase
LSRVVILGAGGLLGSHLVTALGGTGHQVGAYDRRACDITDGDAVLGALRGASAVINCAAFTNVDKSETEPAAATAANALGPEHVAQAAAEVGARAIHISTDFVFDGKKDGPYDEADEPAPLSTYGRTKLEGERRFLRALPSGAVVRVQGLYGHNGANFASKLPELLRAGKALRLDNERRVQPTWAREAALQLIALLDSPVRGVVHLSNTGATTWAGYTRRLAVRLGIPHTFEEVPSAALPMPAARPPNCVLSHRVLREAGIFRLGSWEEAQDGMLAELAARG